jgi:hypothetical protein
MCRSVLIDRTSLYLIGTGRPTLRLALLFGFCSLVFAAPNRIVFSRIGPDATTIFIANADGSGERALVQSDALNYNPAWSPDGKWILKARRDAYSQGIARLQQAASAAASTLLKIMVDPKAPVASRVRAADRVLEHAANGFALEDLQVRVQRVEQNQGQWDDSRKAA